MPQSASEIGAMASLRECALAELVRHGRYDKRDGAANGFFPIGEHTMDGDMQNRTPERV